MKVSIGIMMVTVMLGVTAFVPPMPLPLPQNRILRHDPASPSASSYSTTLLWSAPPKKQLSTVIFQKVVRPAPNQDPLLFLTQLVEFLQDIHKLPSNLPMPYEKSVITKRRTDADDDDDTSVVSFDSPLSSSVEETRLNVQVVGLLRPNEQSSIPSMAMVVLAKAHTHGATKTTVMAPMMKNLFQDCEKRIIKSLERGLDDFAKGKVKFASTPPTTPQQHSSTTSTTSTTTTSSSVNTPLDVSFERTVEDVKAVNVDDEFAVQAAKRASTTKKSTLSSTTKSTDSDGGEFAIKAAKKLAIERNYIGDYATEAAKKFGKRNKQTQFVDDYKEGNDDGDDDDDEEEEEGGNDDDDEVESLKRDSNNHVLVISTPDSHKRKMLKQQKQKGRKENQRQVKALKDSPTTGSSTTSTTTTAATTPVNANSSASKTPAIPGASFKVAPPPTINAEVVEEEKEQEVPGQATRTPPPPSPFSPLDTKRKLNIRTVDQVLADLPSDGDEDLKDPFEKDWEKAMKAKPASPEMQQELKVTEETRKLMDDMQPDDMTAEELLKSVLKFDEDQKKDEADGSGFVSGALEKAKELLREQRKQLDLKEKNSADAPKFRPEIAEPLDEKAELQRIFQAGEKFAESLIASPTTKELSEEANKMVDELVEAEKSVSSYARSIDDELAELEVQINRSPGEELDGPRKNPIFDVMSGPEVYNPNVDPETAVNWPGARPGTKKVRLPKPLDEAVKNAKFAAKVLQELTEEEITDSNGEANVRYTIGKRELSHAQVINLRSVVNEAVKLGIIQDPLLLLQERSRLQMLLDELWHQPQERFREVAENYKDLLLSDNFVPLLQERMEEMAQRDIEAMRRGEDSEDSELQQQHLHERQILGQMVEYAQLLLKETRALGAQLEAQQIEVIRSICKVAMDPKHVTEEETAMALSDAVKDMRPLFDDTFVAYIKYAVAEEEGRLARAGVLDDPEHNEWLFVLKIVQQGVYREIAKTINRYLEHLWYVLRMPSPQQRRDLLASFIEELPTMDVRPFVQVVDNIASSLGDAVNGEIDPYVLGEMTNKILQLHRDMHELLPPERIDLMARDADEWAANQRERMLRQTEIAQQRLKAAQETEHINPDSPGLHLKGEVDRFV